MHFIEQRGRHKHEDCTSHRISEALHTACHGRNAGVTSLEVVLGESLLDLCQRGAWLIPPGVDDVGQRIQQLHLLPAIRK